MTRNWHQRQNGPNRPPLFPHHAPHALPPTLSAALTWGAPLSVQSPGRLVHKRARARGACRNGHPWRCNPGLASLSSCASPADLLLFIQGRCSYCSTGIHIQIAHRHQSTCKSPLAHDPWHKRPGYHCLCRYCEVPSWSWFFFWCEPLHISRVQDLCRFTPHNIRPSHSYITLIMSVFIWLL